ncbi:MAG: hypothetical protein UGF43_02610 [Blautia sp.]|uniref:hypothetical protein n=1 Tax=Blautia sp. TaxID=1955243 RepID=UPI002E78F8D1|nr:hypothetical protein [Blautia sp.]MEE0642862.1 hypothetical protein [Blautia sp.]MEE1442502.1 hypothetical protein [Blautia sp.]
MRRRINVETSRKNSDDKRITIIIRGCDEKNGEKIKCEFQKALLKSKHLLKQKIKYEIISI